MTSKKTTIAILGAGNMGASLLGGLIANQFSSEHLFISDPDAKKLENLKEQFHVHTTIHNSEAIKTVDVIILAVKPQIMSQIAQEIAPHVQEKKPLIISIAAGIRLDALEKWLGKNLPLVRCMPNTPALIRCGASALYANNFVTTEQHDIAESILQAVGQTVWMKDEKLMDAVTALSGSGPAYFFLFMESMQKAGEQLGLPSEIARTLTLQTALGAARMAQESPLSLVELRKAVTSPGGTTEQAIHVLETGHLRDLLHNAMTAAKNRSEELGKSS